ncbi:MAG TPA: glycosyltransferase [Candidatus Baltobacteraceae bacterium]|nr:glycosyltransferase [Candidatus Baltobacteraceae bacterium]
MRFYLGIPTGGAPAQPFLESLLSLQLPVGAEAFERGIVTGNFVPAQRDVLVDRAMRWNADTIAMCDDDMILPPDAFAKLCNVLRADARIALAGALYYSRDGLRPMAVDGWEPSDTTQGWIPAFDDQTPVDVAGVGFGCIAIRASVFSEFTRPFFAAQIYVERNAGRVRVCNEDYLFCARLRAAGYRVVLHPGVRCGHYDRAKARVFPERWEDPQTSNRKRVLARIGERYALVPLEDAPKTVARERQIAADVTYIESDEID